VTSEDDFAGWWRTMTDNLQSRHDHAKLMLAVFDELRGSGRLSPLEWCNSSP
jgi:hypothetical protein